MVNGHHGQRVLIDQASRTVAVQTAVSHDGLWRHEFLALFEAVLQS